MSAPRRIAMWSGPRNISTAMMRAWEHRGDCAVSDEPLYAHYLAATGLPHPMAAGVIAAGETDWRRVVAALTGPVPGGLPLWYQKHMAHHLLPDIERDWVLALDNVFLIRDPAAVVASAAAKLERVSLADIGISQQLELFQRLADHHGAAPPVIDAADFLRDPRAHLQALCARLGIAFTGRMLHWPAGARASDGVWGAHWYDRVNASTGFESPRETAIELDAQGQRVAEAARPAYEALRGHRLRVVAA